ncbi:MAG: hypothetical protein IKO11_02645 [Lachnospiraceae bacterium]|nr:hypothetical protein [Lachnospiraceae bacterium]
MRKILIVLLGMVVSGLIACGKPEKEDPETAPAAGTEVTAADEAYEAEDQEETEMDEQNRKMIAEALGIDESSRNIRFILAGLKQINAGTLKSAEAAEENGEKRLNVVAEDGTNYCIYLSRSGSLDAIKNTDTGEWPIRSMK